MRYTYCSASLVGKKVETTWPWSGSRLAPNPSEHPATYVPAGTFRTVPEHSTSYRNIRHPSYRNMPRPPGTFPELRMHRNILYLAPMGKFIHANSQNWRSFVFESGAASIRNTYMFLSGDDHHQKHHHHNYNHLASSSRYSIHLRSLFLLSLLSS